MAVACIICAAFECYDFDWTDGNLKEKDLKNIFWGRETAWVALVGWTQNPNHLYIYGLFTSVPLSTL